MLCPGGAAEQEGEILPQPLQGLLPASPLSFRDLATACFLHHKCSTGFAVTEGIWALCTPACCWVQARRQPCASVLKRSFSKSPQIWQRETASLLPLFPFGGVLSRNHSYVSRCSGASVPRSKAAAASPPLPDVPLGCQAVGPTLAFTPAPWICRWVCPA